MNAIEFRAHPEYKKCMDKIISYRKGFVFTVDYTQMSTAKANALKIVMADAVKAGYLDLLSIGLALDGTETDETFKRL